MRIPRLLCVLASGITLSAAALRHVGVTEFAPGVISTGHEFTVTFTADGREVYFSRYSANPRWNHVMRSVFRDGAWQPPEPASFSSDTWADLDPALSPDGQRLYFVSTRPHTGSDSASAPDMDIWYADRTGDRWGEPKWLEQASSQRKEGSPTVDRSGNLCFFSDRDGAPNVNAIYCARRSATGWERPIKLGPEINGVSSNTSPSLSADGNRMLFYSDRPGGVGKADLYLSNRRNGEWQAAVGLGAQVNTPESEVNPSLSADGRTLFYGRRGRIFMIPVAELDSLRMVPRILH